MRRYAVGLLRTGLRRGPRLECFYSRRSKILAASFGSAEIRPIHLRINRSEIVHGQCGSCARRDDHSVSRCGRVRLGWVKNDEARMSNDEGSPNDEGKTFPIWSFLIPSSFVIRISSFLLSPSVTNSGS